MATDSGYSTWWIWASCLVVLVVIAGILRVPAEARRLIRLQRKRFYAYLMDKISRRYNIGMKKFKEELFSDISPGRILELGVGSGANIDYYREGTDLIVCEPNEMSKQYLERNIASRKGVRLHEFIVGKAEDLSPIASGSISTCVCTLVLCTVDDVEQVLNEVVRVLKPGGKFYYLEHVRAQAGTSLYYIQALANPVWSVISDGCNVTRETWKLVERAGFSHVRQRRISPNWKLTFRDAFFSIVRPHVLGIATK